MPKKKDKFYTCILWITNRYNTIKSQKKDAQTGLIMLILELQENFSGCHAHLYVSRLTYNVFLFNYWICRFFPMFLYCFCSPRAFLYFPLRKATSCSKYTYCHSCKLEFLSNLGSDNMPLLFWAYQLISLLNLTDLATTILYHSSLAISFISTR